jgi:peptide-methionine (S)-S-oxide reductase
MIQKAVFGGGCFWCLEAIFQRVSGVIEVVSGYSGGKRKNPTYENICSGATGHAEVIEITFDDEIIDFNTLLEVFFSTHDSTQLNRQGNDVGTQYRSVIFYLDEEQKKLSENFKHKLIDNGINSVTEISPLDVFYKAEDYHQNYFNLNPQNPYCGYVIAPKVEKFLNSIK